jgi:hypothetical protein
MREHAPAQCCASASCKHLHCGVQLASVRPRQRHIRNGAVMQRPGELLAEEHAAACAAGLDGKRTEPEMHV